MSIGSLSDAELLRYRRGHSLERAQQLATADLLAAEMLQRPVQIYRDKSGAPHIPDVPQRLSISHTGDHLAILISSSPVLALDIELLDRSIDRIIPRFTYPHEMDLFQKQEAQNPALWLWSIKECLFKAVPISGIVFKEHLQIHSVARKNEHLIALCAVEHPRYRKEISVVSRIFGPLIVSYIDQSD